MLAMFGGSAGGSLLTIEHYRRIADRHAAYEEEVAQSEDILAGQALVRRIRRATYQRRGRLGE
jgi:hypothetical protein